MPDEVYDVCKKEQAKGNPAFKWSGIFMRGFRAACGIGKDEAQDEKIERIMQKLDFYVQLTKRQEQALTLLSAEKGK